MSVRLSLITVLVISACAKMPDASVEPTVQEAISDALAVENGTSGDPERKQSLFAFLKPKPQPEPETEADILVVDDTKAQPTAEPQGRAFAALSGPKNTNQSGPDTKPKGFFAGLLAGKTAEPAPGVDDDVQLASLDPDAPDSTPAKSGLFARSDKTTVQPGEVLPFGAVGVACNLPRRQMGKEVDKFPKTGRARWHLFDTDPASTGPRTQFITGFGDGCARQFTASLALFGSPALHEIHRYSASQKRVPYSQADKAYEKVKASVCGVGKGQECPVSKAQKLEKSTSFVSVYPRFGGATEWMELLLSDGKMLASETRRP